MTSTPLVTSLKRLRPAAMFSAALAAAGCGSDSTGPEGPPPARGTVVLNTFGQRGVTLVPDTGTATAHIDFGEDFDGGSFALQSDTLLSTSSSFGGDKLYVADLAARSVETLQMPAASNPAGAAFVGGAARFAVALRNSGQVALVRRTGVGTAALTLLDGAGRCPTDVFQYGGAIYAVDANASCAEGTYASQGPARLIRIPTNGAARDTIPLPISTGSVASAIVDGNYAYVAVNGVADFSNFPAATFVTPGSVSKVNLATGETEITVSFAPGTYGAGMRRGADGRLYVAVYTQTDFSRQVIHRITPSTMQLEAELPLQNPADGAANCGAATADAAGNVHCVVTDAGGASTLLVFDLTGAPTRGVPAGTYAADVARR